MYCEAAITSISSDILPYKLPSNKVVTNRLPVTNILARRRRSPQEDYILPSPLVGSSNGSYDDSSYDEEYFNFYGEGNYRNEEDEEEGKPNRDEIEGLPRDVYCDLATTLRYKTEKYSSCQTYWYE